MGISSRFRHRAQLYEQLSALLGAGVPVVRALNVLIKTKTLGRDRGGLRKVLREVEEGTPLGEALAGAGRAVPELDRAVIAVGERSGRLDQTLTLLAASCQQSAVLAGETLSRLVYPVMILHVALLVFPVTLIVDMVVEGQAMPFLVQKLKMFGGLYGAVFLLGYGLPRLFGGAPAALAEAVVRRVPVLGRSLHRLALARLAFALDVQLSAGIGAIEAWSRAAGVCGSHAIRREVYTWQGPLEAGATPGELAGRSRWFAGVFAEFYQTGELSGRLEDSLQRIQQVCREEGSAGLRLLAEWVPRVIYLALVLYVAYFVIAFYGGYFSSLGL